MVSKNHLIMYIQHAEPGCATTAEGHIVSQEQESVTTVGTGSPKALEIRKTWPGLFPVFSCLVSVNQNYSDHIFSPF